MVEIENDSTHLDSLTKTNIPSDSSNSLPWVEKYRPLQLSELISHEQITNTLTKLIEGNKLPHLLFYGPPGTGKTSTIHAVANKIFGRNYASMILELNASDDRGIDVVRQQIKEFANTRNIFRKGIKLVILDEADAMTSAAQAALRRVIEKFTRSTRFCLICNYLNKIIPALQSRCTRFRFAPLNEEQVLLRLQEIVKTERINITETGMQAVVRLGQGDMRKCLNILQAAFLAYSDIDEDKVYQCTGNPRPTDIMQILEWLLNEDFTLCLSKISIMQRTRGLALVDVLRELHLFILRMSLESPVKALLLVSLAEIEQRLCNGSGTSNERLNLGALVAAFQYVRATTTTTTTTTTTNSSDHTIANTITNDNNNNNNNIVVSTGNQSNAPL